MRTLNQLQDIAVIRFGSHEIGDETERVLEAIDNNIMRRLVKRMAPHPPAPSPRSTEAKGSSRNFLCVHVSRFSQDYR